MSRHLRHRIRLHLTCSVCESDAHPSQASLGQTTTASVCVCVCVCLHVHLRVETSSSHPRVQLKFSRGCLRFIKTIRASRLQTNTHRYEASFPQNVMESDCHGFEEIAETLHGDL